MLRNLKRLYLVFDFVLVAYMISVKDGLPKDGQRVLCKEQLTGRYSEFELYYYRAGIGFVYNIADDDPYANVTHWKELPE